MPSIVGPGPTTYKGSIDSEGWRTYRVRYKILADPGDGPANILQTPGLPTVGSPWLVNDDVDVYAWFRFDSEANPLISGDDDGPQEYWFVDRMASNKPLPPNQQRCQDEPVEDPLLEPQRIRGTFVKYVEEATHDRFGIPIKTSSHEMYRGPSVEFDKNRPQVTIEQNVADLQLGLLSSMVDCLNTAELWGLPPRRIKLSNVSWEKLYHGQCEVYYKRTLEFDIRYEGFDRDLLDEGTKVLYGHWDPDTATGTGAGLWVTDQIGGSDPDPDNPTHFIRFKDRNGENCRVLLNGAGLPAETATAVSITNASHNNSTGRVTFTTDTSHGLEVGDKVTIVGIKPTTFNGQWNVLVAATATTFEAGPAVGDFGAYTSGGYLLSQGTTGVGVRHIEKYEEADFLLLGVPVSF